MGRRWSELYSKLPENNWESKYGTYPVFLSSFAIDITFFLFSASLSLYLSFFYILYFDSLCFSVNFL